MAQRKMLSPNTTLWWIDTTGVANFSTITAAEINAGANISCAIQTGYTLNPTDSDTDDTKSICDNSNAANPTFKNYEGNFTIFRSIIGETAGVFYVAYNLFKKPDHEGFLVRRLGKANTAVAAIGDTVSVFGFTNDVPGDVESDSGGPIGMTVPLLPTGKMNNFYTLAA